MGQETYTDLEKEAMEDKKRENSRRVLFERILVKPEEQVTESSAGIIIPNDARKRPQIGHIVQTGEGSKNNPMIVEPGERVLFNRYAGQEVILNGELHYIIMLNEIQMVLDEGDTIEFEQ